MANISSIPDKTGGHKGREQYTHAKADARKDLRREEAEDRQAAYDALSITAKIARAKSRRGESKRELLRLSKKTDKAEWDKAQAVTAKVASVPVAPVVPEKSKRTPKSKVIAEAKAQRPSKS